MIFVPKINPVRFRQTVSGKNTSIDFGTQFGDVDYANICNAWDLDLPFIFQFHSASDIPTLTVNGAPLAYTNITPIGWQGEFANVFEASYQPSLDGETFFFEIQVSGYIHTSDTITAVEDTSSLVKIQYRNSENNYGYVGNTMLTAFVYAEYLKPIPANDLVVYNDDKGEMVKLIATPNEVYELKVIYAEYFIVNMLNLIFSCDDILVNGQPFQVQETPTADRIQTSNINTCIIQLQRTGDNYMFFTGENEADLPVCVLESEVQWWFVKNGTNYVNKSIYNTGYTVKEQSGRINFLTSLPLGGSFADFEIFNRNNTTIQNSNTKAGYSAPVPYSFTLDEVSMLFMHDCYNEFHKGKVYISQGRQEIIILNVDKTLGCDKQMKERSGYDSFWLEDISGDVLLEFEKYNVINY